MEYYQDSSSGTLNPTHTLLCLSQIYNNTLHNWPLLDDRCQLRVHPILFVDKSNVSSQTVLDNSTIDVALSLGWTVLDVPRLSFFGVPCIRDMYADVALRFANCTFHAYTNGDILFDSGLARTLRSVAKVSYAGAREPWRQSRRGSHKISPNGAKIGLGSHKFSEVIDYSVTTSGKVALCG